MTQELATALIKTILKRPDQPTIIHSDMGSQYTSVLFEHTLAEAGIKHSYSRQGCPLVQPGTYFISRVATVLYNEAEKK